MNQSVTKLTTSQSSFPPRLGQTFLFFPQILPDLIQIHNMPRAILGGQEILFISEPPPLHLGRKCPITLFSDVGILPDTSHTFAMISKTSEMPTHTFPYEVFLGTLTDHSAWGGVNSPGSFLSPRHQLTPVHHVIPRFIRNLDFSSHPFIPSSLPHHLSSPPSIAPIGVVFVSETTDGMFPCTCTGRKKSRIPLIKTLLHALTSGQTSTGNLKCLLFF